METETDATSNVPLSQLSEAAIAGDAATEVDPGRLNSSAAEGPAAARESPLPTKTKTTWSEEGNKHFVAPKMHGLARFSKRERERRKSRVQYTPWEEKGRGPYHEYVHGLVEAGWVNLSGLDKFLSTDYEDENLYISVVDITQDFEYRRQEDIRDEGDLKEFMSRGRPKDTRVRLYLAEQSGPLASGVIEALGSSLKLDPRFFQWNLYGHERSLLSPSERHRSKYTTIGFTIPNPATRDATDTYFFRISIYIQPDETGPGWTGVLIFNSHYKVNLSVHEFVAPPDFPEVPSMAPKHPMSFRELYLSSFNFINIKEAAVSPFYATHFLFRLNCYCWSQIILAIRQEDEKLQGISNGSVDHVEEIQKTYSLIQRGGTLGWQSSDGPHTVENKARLEEDFKHLLDQADLLWQTRQKRAAIRTRNRDARATTLTNAFTFFFVPISLISSIYGMNVVQISGSDANPNIWQFFVVVIGLNAVIVVALMISHFFHQQFTYKRRAGWREVFRFAVGRDTR